MRKKQSKLCSCAGFSLIEFAVIAAIVVLLVAIAYPFYKNYRAQGKVTQIFSISADQMAQYQQHVSTGAPFNIVTTNLGNYIAIAEITGNGGVAQSGGANGNVFIQLNTDNSTGAASIDPALGGLQMTFTPQSTAVTADAPVSMNVAWVCTFNASTSSDPATATKLLSSGDCIAQ